MSSVDLRVCACVSVNEHLLMAVPEEIQLLEEGGRGGRGVGAGPHGSTSPRVQHYLHGQPGEKCLMLMLTERPCQLKRGRQRVAHIPKTHNEGEL